MKKETKDEEEISPLPPELKEYWERTWPGALELWSRYTKISDPIWCMNEKQDKEENLSDSFAMIRLSEHRVIISLHKIHKLGLNNFAKEILAHEIGHHVYCPGDLNDQAKMLARMRLGLPYKENMAPFISNLYSDLLINYKLQRDFNLDIASVYKIINPEKFDKLWLFYMRIYEILFSLPRRSLAVDKIQDSMEGDAQLANRLIRNYGRDWLLGSGRFAALCLPYLMENEYAISLKSLASWNDTRDCAAGEVLPDGLTEIDEDELEGCIHPALEGSDQVSGEKTEIQKKLEPVDSKGETKGQYRQPFEYGEILKSLGIKLPNSDITIKYYKERALSYLVPFPVQKNERVTEPLPEGLDTWDIGSPLENINWVETVIRSPVVIPGYTTVEQTYGTAEGDTPQIEPVDLDIYIDCSGSMPNPSYKVSYLALAGTIIALSALRTGASVQATLWSGTKQFKTTDGFIRDEKKILEIVCGYIGGATAFPIHIMRDTYALRTKKNKNVHILQISDDGITTMFNVDEKGNSGKNIAEMALQNARAGGTFVLNLWNDWKKDKLLVQAHEMGWDIHIVRKWEELLIFAKEFSKKKYTLNKKR